jgi:anthranilate phosphoribosyltransferase
VLEALGFNLELAPETIARRSTSSASASCSHPRTTRPCATRRRFGASSRADGLQRARAAHEPGRARAQVVGVYAPELVPTIAEVLARLAPTARSSCTAPAVSTSSRRRAQSRVRGRHGEVRRREIDPLEPGIDRCAPDELGGGGPAENAETIDRSFAAPGGGSETPCC